MKGRVATNKTLFDQQVEFHTGLLGLSATAAREKRLEADTLMILELMRLGYTVEELLPIYRCWPVGTADNATRTIRKRLREMRVRQNRPEFRVLA